MLYQFFPKLPCFPQPSLESGTHSRELGRVGKVCHTGIEQQVRERDEMGTIKTQEKYFLTHTLPSKLKKVRGTTFTNPSFWGSEALISITNTKSVSGSWRMQWERTPSSRWLTSHKLCFKKRTNNEGKQICVFYGFLCDPPQLIVLRQLCATVIYSTSGVNVTVLLRVSNTYSDTDAVLRVSPYEQTQFTSRHFYPVASDELKRVRIRNNPPSSLPLERMIASVFSPCSIRVLRLNEWSNQIASRLLLLSLCLSELSVRFGLVGGRTNIFFTVTTADGGVKDWDNWG